MRTTVATVLTFGASGNAHAHQGAGWSGPEDGHTWAVGEHSRLSVDAPDAPFGYVLEFLWTPLLDPPFTPVQTASVAVNGATVARAQVGRGGVAGFLCPPPGDGSTLVIDIRHPDFVRASERFGGDDARELAISFHRLRVLALSEPLRPRAGPMSDRVIGAAETRDVAAEIESRIGRPANELFRRFEMLAGNCDLGLAARDLGHESLSLLRFAGATPEVAIRGLETGFLGVGDAIDAATAENPIKEWMVNDSFGLRLHTGKSSLDVGREQVLRAYPAYMKRLAQKFMEDVRAGEKVFVYADHRNFSVSRGLDAVLPLYLALRSQGGRRLLWVCPAGGESPHRGGVREILPGLAQAHLDVLAPPVNVGGGISLPGWATVLVNAWHVFGLGGDAR